MAVITIAEAAQHGLPIPYEASKLIWARLREHPDAPWAVNAAETLVKLANKQVLNDVRNVVIAPDSGNDLLAISLDILTGPPAAMLTDADLLNIAERCTSPRIVSRVGCVVRAATDHRHVPPDVLIAIVESWFARSEKIGLTSGLDLIDILPREAGQKFLLRALKVEHASVRSAAAQMVGDLFDHRDAVHIVDEAIAIETRSRVIAELLTAKAILVMNAPS